MIKHKQINIWGDMANKEAEADKRIMEIVSKLGGLEDGDNRLKRKKPRIKYFQ